jgi:hypothetical protein
MVAPLKTYLCATIHFPAEITQPFWGAIMAINRSQTKPAGNKPGAKPVGKPADKPADKKSK